MKGDMAVRSITASISLCTAFSAPRTICRGTGSAAAASSSSDAIARELLIRLCVLSRGPAVHNDQGNPTAQRLQPPLDGPRKLRDDDRGKQRLRAFLDNNRRRTGGRNRHGDNTQAAGPLYDATTKALRPARKHPS